MARDVRLLRCRDVRCVAIMAFALPRRNPKPGLTYGALIASLWHLLVTTLALQRRAIYQAFFFGAFTMFWTACAVAARSSCHSRLTTSHCPG